MRSNEFFWVIPTKGASLKLLPCIRILENILQSPIEAFYGIVCEPLESFGLFSDG